MFQCCSSAAEEARKEIYVQKFLHIAGLLNEQLSTTPLLYGSLGLELRGEQVMIDSDLADIYGYELKAMNQQVRRNFSGQGGGRRKLPYAFTEQGIYMLAILRSMGKMIDIVICRKLWSSIWI